MLRKNLYRSLLITLALLQIAFFPHVSFAEGTNPISNTADKPAAASTTDAASTPAGPEKPTGADSSTFVYNKDTGLWENDYYTWNPVTKQTAPKAGTLDYSYNPETKKWDTTDWRYDAPSGKYIPNVTQSTTAPAGAVVPSDSPAAPHALAAAKVATDGPDSPTKTNVTNNTNGAYDLFYNASISNKINSAAQTGDATVASNTLGGNAGTGNASDMATILNMLQSVWDPSNGKIATFNADINGDVNGDITLDPGQIPQNLGVNNKTDNTNLVVNESANAAINNDINLKATTGNAKVTGNTTGGDATTGTANAVANVVNLLNSYIGAGQSFVGTINVNGNLNGDILLPQDMLTQLLASNVPKATIDLSKVSNSNIIGQFNDNTNINNNVKAAAGSGNANVSNNSAAGGATTGNADTNVTILNLTGRQIVGSNALLVFVNVLGHWVGMIMDAPGATSAALGGGITNDTTNVNAAVKETSNTAINNNINLDSKSGNADVSGNSKAGAAKTGDATASANIANVSNSKLSLSGWFGVLFINVFGNWLGSFGINTSAGNQPPAPAAAPAQADVKVFGFTPSSGGDSYSLTPVPTTGNLGTSGNASNTNAAAVNTQVLGASTTNPSVTQSGGLNPIAKAYVALAFIGLIVMLGGKLFAFLKAKKI